MSKIEIRKVSIIDVGTDAIVNAANEGLWAGSGVCGAIFDAAGMDQLTKACKAIGHCDTGSAVITPGFNLCKYIIHAVGPQWGGDEHVVKIRLYTCYKTALRLAIKNGCRSIGFPLISAGIFGVPVDIAWRKALQACYEFPEDIQIVFAVLDQDILEAGKNILREITEADSSNKPDATYSKNPMIIFHDTDKEYGFLSNWFLSDFTIDGVTFSSVEQYLMYRKAEIFHDSVHMKLIMSTDDPETIKQYGREVTPFNSTIWDGYRQIVLYQGLCAKFHNAPDLLNQLISTGDSILVQGTASDKVFANGLKRNDPTRFDMSKWKGQNLLGFTLMEVRRQEAYRISHSTD